MHERSIAVKSYIQKATDLVSGNSHSVKGYLNLSVLRAVQLLLGLLGTHFLAHSLSITQYGEYQFILNVIGMLTVFTLTEAANTLIQSIARGHKGSFRKVLPYPFLFSLIGSFILLGFSLFYGLYKIHHDMMIGFLMAAIFFPFMYGLTIWRGFRIGEQKFASYTFVEIFSLFLLQGGTIVLSLLFQQSYIEVVAWFLLVTAGTNIAMTYRVLKRTGLDEPAEEGVVPHTIKASLYTSFPNASNYVDKLLLVYFLDATALALYIAAERIPELLRMPMVDIASTLAPRLAVKEKYTLKLDLFFKWACIAFGIGALLFSYAVMPWLILKIYGTQYADAVPYAHLIMMGVILGNLGSLQVRYIRSKLDTAHLRNIMIVTSVVRVVISLILIPLLGLAGAALSAFLHKAVMSFIINRTVTKNYM